MDLKKIKSLFPIFRAHSGLVYLDSATTTQTPQAVLDAMNEYYTKYRANVHRGLYDISIAASEAFEASRASLASFINAAPEEILFTSGTTHSLNALAYTLAPRLTHRDNVVLTRMEHHSNLVPWQEMAKHYGFEIRFIELNEPRDLPSIPSSVEEGQSQSLPLLHKGEGRERYRGDYTLNLASAARVIDANTKIVSFTAASNVLGTINPVEEIIKITRRNSPRAYTIIDAAQSIAHLPVDVKNLDCDFLVFSGHKMYGPTGIGVLYGKKVMLTEHLEPFLFGGEMVGDVTYESATWNEVPWKFEAGTQNIAGVIGLGAAVKFIQDIGMNTIIAHEAELTEYALTKLAPLVTLIGPTRNPLPASPSAEEEGREPPPSQRRGQGEVSRLGVFSFVVPGAHPHDAGEIVNREGVCIRVGHHCAMPLHKLLGLVGTARASVGIYTTKEDIDKLSEGVKKVREIFSATG